MKNLVNFRALMLFQLRRPTDMKTSPLGVTYQSSEDARDAPRGIPGIRMKVGYRKTKPRIDLKKELTLAS